MYRRESFVTERNGKEIALLAPLRKPVRAGDSLGSRAVSSSVPLPVPVPAPDPESRRTMANSMDTIRSDKLHRRLINVDPRSGFSS
jgi:hypothetical protein